MPLDMQQAWAFLRSPEWHAGILATLPDGSMTARYRRISPAP